MKLVIIGGGASGVMCAITAKKKNPKLEVTILEQNDRLLKKVLKTGNGKCNIANSIITDDYYNSFSIIEKNKDVNVTQSLKELGILQKETTLGRIYPYSESAKTVVNQLISEVERLKINVKTNCEVKNIQNLDYDYLVIATGSCAQEKTCGYKLLQSIGHKISPLSPGLVPLVTEEDTKALQGIRWKCNAHVMYKEKKKVISGELLFKNDGLSGIITLDISRLISPPQIISFDLMPEYSLENISHLLNENNISLYGIFPKMLAIDIVKRANTSHKKIEEVIKNYSFKIKEKKEFSEAQITLGGVLLSEINDDFSSKKKSNIYITGEVLDVDGASGGYNLYFAWLSGIVSGLSICAKNEDN